MDYHQIVAKMRDVFGNANCDRINGHLAVQFNIYGEGEGALYVEISDGKIDIQPYEYYDRNATIYIPSKVLIDICDGTLDMQDAYNNKLMHIDGDLGAALLLYQIEVQSADK